MIEFQLNGKMAGFDGDESTPLLWVLRDHLGMPGTKFGCGIGSCGACTVHVDGKAQKTCVLPVSRVAGRSVTTIEGLAKDGSLHPVQLAWIEHDVPQCGYCQAGQIMSAVDLLSRKPRPSDEDINEEMTNICRCGTYVRIRKAVHHAAELMAKGS